MYQQLYVYDSPARNGFRFIGKIEEVDGFPACYPGSVWPIQLPDTALPDWFVVVDIPLIRQRKRKDNEMEPVIEIFLAPIQDQWLYGDPGFPFLRAA